MKAILIALLSLVAYSASAQMQSVYTSVDVKDCVTVTSSEMDKGPIDFYTGECPAMGGYKVTITGGDIRYNLDLSYEGVRIPTLKPMQFHDMGSSKIEWRYKRTGSDWNSYQVEYTALIYRLNLDSYNPATGESKPQDTLVVVRLNGASSCVVGMVEQQANMNQKARQIADNPAASCVNEENIR
jgi:hypothetical protein